MSLQNLGNVEHKRYNVSFESISLYVQDLKNEIQKFKPAIENLEEKINYEEYRRLYMTFQSVFTKVKEYQQQLDELTKNDPFHPKAEYLKNEIDGIINNLTGMESGLKDVVKIQKSARQAELEKEKVIKEQNEMLMKQEKVRREQHLEEQLQEDNEHTEKEMNNINEMAQNLQSTTKDCDEQLDDGHNTLLNTNETIDTAHEEMKKGNQKLREGEKIQKHHYHRKRLNK
ncbi:hypothetical protein TRFO_27028 [Tritrichomonas foetus]|uniref:Uncharacterized protein n=1 Tax=Tritrichomonas foetus TaxID=1144522 RepID=A0A1J4K2T1_9EUKA|nr:hypothetical protein TRFO_27028 [Tritrichomonas foetus]|eukprot:OHT05274.1 hypothetical protein TRFO_27028 [Tritrichomonas foetus]